MKSPLWGRQGTTGRVGEEGVHWLWKKLEMRMKSELQSRQVRVWSICVCACISLYAKKKNMYAGLEVSVCMGYANA